MEGEEVFVHNHAYKHGLDREDILHAWENAYASQPRTGPWPPQYVSIGPDRHGRDVQIVSVWDDDDCRWVIFHAMLATSGVRRELGVDRKKNRRR